MPVQLLAGVSVPKFESDVNAPMTSTSPTVVSLRFNPHDVDDAASPTVPVRWTKLLVCPLICINKQAKSFSVAAMFSVTVTLPVEATTPVYSPLRRCPVLTPAL